MTRKGERVHTVQVRTASGSWEPLQEEKTYTALSNAYLIENAGDGYFWFRQYGTEPKNTFTTFYSTLASELARCHTLDPKPMDGRLKVLR